MATMVELEKQCAALQKLAEKAAVERKEADKRARDYDRAIRACEREMLVAFKSSVK